MTIERHRGVIRFGLIYLAVTIGVVAAWILITPKAARLGLATLAVLAAVWMERRLVQAAHRRRREDQPLPEIRSQARPSFRLSSESSSSASSSGPTSIAPAFSVGCGSASAPARSTLSRTPRSKISST
jgi:hypothetical protein